MIVKRSNNIISPNSTNRTCVKYEAQWWASTMHVDCRACFVCPIDFRSKLNCELFRGVTFFWFFLFLLLHWTRCWFLVSSRNRANNARVIYCTYVCGIRWADRKEIDGARDCLFRLNLNAYEQIALQLFVIDCIAWQPIFIITYFSWNRCSNTLENSSKKCPKRVHTEMQPQFLLQNSIKSQNLSHLWVCMSLIPIRLHTGIIFDIPHVCMVVRNSIYSKHIQVKKKNDINMSYSGNSLLPKISRRQINCFLNSQKVWM